MAIKESYLSDFEAILSHRYEQGADLWTTPDNRLIKGSPFSTLECIRYLLEIGLEPDEPLLKQCANVLCHLGYAKDVRMQKTFQHLLKTQYPDGGWRCNKFSFGRGPETEYSNPLPTLTILDAFRFSDYLNQEPALDRGVEFLLEHWTIRKPIGPCHYGIGKLFMQVEYPFRNYNLFVYVYVLSFYKRAREDHRFLEALKILESKLSDGQIVVERVVPKLAKYEFCKKGKPSELATKRYLEIVNNLNG